VDVILKKILPDNASEKYLGKVIENIFNSTEEFNTYCINYIMKKSRKILFYSCPFSKLLTRKYERRNKTIKKLKKTSLESLQIALQNETVAGLNYYIVRRYNNYPDIKKLLGIFIKIKKYRVEFYNALKKSTTRRRKID
jgi:hypothetical protein